MSFDEFLELLRAEMAERGWGPYDLRKATAMPVVYKWLSGEVRDAKLGQIKRVCDALGVRLVWRKEGSDGQG